MKTRAVILMILLAAPCALLVRHASAQPEGPVATGVSDRLRVLETQMVDVKRANGALRGKLPGLTSRVQELLEKVHTVEGAGGAHEKKGPEPDKVKPQTVEYRPPL